MKFDNVADLQTDTELERVKGAVIDFGEGRWMRCLRPNRNNRKYTTRLQALMKPHTFKLQQGVPIPPEVDIEIMARAYASGVVIAWGGWKSGGQEVPLSEEALVDLLTAPENATIYARLVAELDAHATWRKAALDEVTETIKND